MHEKRQIWSAKLSGPAGRCADVVQDEQVQHEDRQGQLCVARLLSDWLADAGCFPVFVSRPLLPLDASVTRAWTPLTLYDAKRAVSWAEETG